MYNFIRLSLVKQTGEDLLFPLFLCRGLYIAVIFYYKDNMLVTNEDQIPIVEIDDSHASSITQDFLWFTKVH